MNATAWIISGVLTLIFGVAGLVKLTRSKEALAPSLPWVEDVTRPVVRFSGAAELAGALGLVLPAATPGSHPR